MIMKPGRSPSFRWPNRKSFDPQAREKETNTIYNETSISGPLSKSHGAPHFSKFRREMVGGVSKTHTSIRLTKHTADHVAGFGGFAQRF